MKPLTTWDFRIQAEKITPKKQDNVTEFEASLLSSISKQYRENS